MPALSLLRACFLVLLAAFAAEAHAGVLIEVDKSTQRMTVSVDGTERYSWPVSTGLSRYATPGGSYRPFRLEEDHYSKEWDEAPMPHSIFFTARGHAIHGSDATRRLGSPASHGCIRLSRANAAALFDLVKQEGLNETKIVVRGDEAIAMGRSKPQAARTAAATDAPPKVRTVRRQQPTVSVDVERTAPDPYWYGGTNGFSGRASSRARQPIYGPMGYDPAWW